jgi:hypothetical protein
VRERDALEVRAQSCDLFFRQFCEEEVFHEFLAGRTGRDGRDFTPRGGPWQVQLSRARARADTLNRRPLLRPSDNVPSAELKFVGALLSWPDEQETVRGARRRSSGLTHPFLTAHERAARFACSRAAKHARPLQSRGIRPTPRPLP